VVVRIEVRTVHLPVIEVAGVYQLAYTIGKDEVLVLPKFA